MMPSDNLRLLSNILADRALCVEWAHATGLLTRLTIDHPLTRINEMTMRQYLDRAIGFLVQEGVPIREIWALEDLVTPTAFLKITRSALAQSPAAARCMALVLLTTAQQWIGIDADHARRLEEITDGLPRSSFPRRLGTQRRLLNAARPRLPHTTSLTLKTPA